MTHCTQTFLFAGYFMTADSSLVPPLRRDYRIMAELHDDHRTETELKEHLAVERRLAARLASANAEERPRLYGGLYRELFDRLPHHPQHSADRIAHRFQAPQVALLRKLVPRGAAFVEIGAGDGYTCVELADHCASTTAVDVTDALAPGAEAPANFRFLVTDGVTLDLPDASTDFVYSYQLMEHLHPEDAARQVREIRRVLRPGGVHYCVTPHGATGPHDISKYFQTRTPLGFHLIEYTYASLAKLFLEAGFSRAEPMLVRKSSTARLPLAAAMAAENLIGALDGLSGRRLRWNPKVRGLLGIHMLAHV